MNHLHRAGTRPDECTARRGRLGSAIRHEVGKECAGGFKTGPSRRKVARDARYAVEIGVVAGEVSQAVRLHQCYDQSVVAE